MKKACDQSEGQAERRLLCYTQKCQSSIRSTWTVLVAPQSPARAAGVGSFADDTNVGCARGEGRARM